VIDANRPLKKAHLPPACPKQAFRIVALDRCGNHSRSKQGCSNVLPKYASARRFLAHLVPGTFLTGLATGLFNTLQRLDVILAVRHQSIYTGGRPW